MIFSFFFFFSSRRRHTRWNCDWSSDVCSSDLTRRLQLRREEALTRLKHAEAELVRVVDILREIGPRVELLREQVAKWNEYEHVRSELRRRALRWYRASFGSTATTRAELAAKIVGVDREILRLTDYVTEGETVTAGTDEDLRAAREEDERRRI